MYKRQLFLRAKNELLLTPAGQLYVEAAQNVVEIKKQLYKNISDLDHKAHIVISTTSLWGNRLFADVIPQFREDVYKRQLLSVYQLISCGLYRPRHSWLAGRCV